MKIRMLIEKIKVIDLKNELAGLDEVEIDRRRVLFADLW